MRGYIYIITNIAWPEYVKIGRTYNINKRISAYQTCSPFRDFEIYYYAHTMNISIIENIFINLYGKNNGEWYKIDKEEAKLLIEKNIIHKPVDNVEVINSEVLYKNEIIYDCFEFDNCKIDFISLECNDKTNTKHILSTKEALILKLLTTNEGEIVSKDKIISEVYKFYTEDNFRSIDNHIVKFRKLFDKKHFLTIRGIGYKFIL